jgi:hypothetical protein
VARVQNAMPPRLIRPASSPSKKPPSSPAQAGSSIKTKPAIAAGIDQKGTLDTDLKSGRGEISEINLELDQWAKVVFTFDRPLAIPKKQMSGPRKDKQAGKRSRSSPPTRRESLLDQFASYAVPDAQPNAASSSRPPPLVPLGPPYLSSSDPSSSQQSPYDEHALPFALSDLPFQMDHFGRLAATGQPYHFHQPPHQLPFIPAPASALPSASHPRQDDPQLSWVFGLPPFQMPAPPAQSSHGPLEQPQSQPGPSRSSPSRRSSTSTSQPQSVDSVRSQLPHTESKQPDGVQSQKTFLSAKIKDGETRKRLVSQAGLEPISARN